MTTLSDDQLEILKDFIQESLERIEQLEPNIIELEEKKDDPEVINSVFRLFHSIKGGAGFLNLNNISHAAHAAENLLELIRSGRIQLNSNHIDLLCQACDFIKEAMDYAETHQEDEGMADQASVLISNLSEHTKKPQPTEEEYQQKEIEEIDNLPELKITQDMISRFIQEQEELLQEVEEGLLKWIKSPKDTEIVDSLFRAIHSFKGNNGFYGYADIENLSHQMETVLDVSRSDANKDNVNSAETLLKLLDILRDSITDIATNEYEGIKNLDIYLELLEGLLPKGWLSDEERGEKQRIGDLLLEEGEITPKDIDEALEAQRRPFGKILIDKGVSTPEKINAALEEQEKSKQQKRRAERKKPAQPNKPAIKRQDIRVNLEKLDNLINLIGEMVIAENMLTHSPDLVGLELESFYKTAQQMNKIVRELQGVAMNIRMIPISGLFRRMIRLVHDLSVKSGKKVELKISGETTEVDKTVIETITDPLVHLIRNSIDHGLEIPEERVKMEKPETGVINLSAVHKEGEVWITISDDGKGLNKEKILEKAKEKGLIEGDGSQLSEKEIFNLIFLPGFSTASAVTDVSGRGVGMDVVKKNLEKIKGKIEVHSREGGGTQINLRIPLTLAIIDGMMVRVGRSKYILPILVIKESFCPLKEAITVSPDGMEMVRVRKNLIPILRLNEIHKIESDQNELDKGILIVLELAKLNICLFVDEIIGQQQTVIKGLSDYFGNVRGISGCTLLGNGDVCLILDVENLVEMANL